MAHREPPSNAKVRPPPADGVVADYAGWIVGFGLAAAVLVIGAGLWFRFHP